MTYLAGFKASMRLGILNVPGGGSRKEKKESCKATLFLKLKREENSSTIPCQKSSNRSYISFCIKNLQNHNAFPPLKLDMKYKS